MYPKYVCMVHVFLDDSLWTCSLLNEIRPVPTILRDENKKKTVNVLSWWLEKPGWKTKCFIVFNKASVERTFFPINKIFSSRITFMVHLGRLCFVHTIFLLNGRKMHFYSVFIFIYFKISISLYLSLFLCLPILCRTIIPLQWSSRTFWAKALAIAINLPEFLFYAFVVSL